MDFPSLPADKVGRYGRFCLMNGARAAYRTLVATDKRAVLAEFAHADGPVTMIFARAGKAAELRELLFGSYLQPSETVISPGYDGSLGKNDEALILAGVRAALRAMSKHDRNILLVQFDEPVIEPLLAVYARGDKAVELRAIAFSAGLIDPPVAA